MTLSDQPSKSRLGRDSFVRAPSASRCTMKNGSLVTIRPICPEDELLMVRFHETLSDRTVYLRYFASLSLHRRVAHERLSEICAGDQESAIVLVADYWDSGADQHYILGVGRLNLIENENAGEVAVLIADQFQGQGLGTALLERLLQVARNRQLARLDAEMMRDNLPMQTLLKRLGFRLSQRDDPDSVHAALNL